MTSPRSMFTEAIEDHLALKKQNAHLEPAMPIARFDVGDPLDRYPGGPARAVVEADTPPAGVTDAATPDALAATASANVAAAMASAASVVEGDFRQPIEPLNGMTPMLSLVQDLDEDDADTPVSQLPAYGNTVAAAAATMMMDTPAPEASVVRFPGGVGPREDAAATEGAVATADPAAETTGEQPVIVIDADEPLAPLTPGPMEPRRAQSKRPRFFNLRRRKQQSNDGGDAGWFSSNPGDFNWD